MAERKPIVLVGGEFAELPAGDILTLRKIKIARSNGTIANGANNNVALVDDVSYMTFTGPTGAYSVSGFANIFDGRLLYVYFNIANTLTLKHDSGSTVGQRLTLPGGADIVFGVTPVRCLFIYDASVGGGVGYWVLFSALDKVPGTI